MDLVDRARSYVSKMEPSISGSNGHTALMKAASALVVGFDFENELALSILRTEFNPRCNPRWSERDLQHKVNQARIHKQGEFGHLIGKQRTQNPGNSLRSETRKSHAAVGNAPEPERPRKRAEFDQAALKAMQLRGFTPCFKWLAERSPLDPREVTPAGFLDVILEPGEKTLVFERFTSQGEFGHVAGRPGQVYRIGARPGHLPVKTEAYPLSAREGMWYLPCPLDGQWYATGKVDEAGNPILSRRTGKSVTCYRQLLLESDAADEMEWLNLLCQLPLPISALYTSGGRSIHALVRVACDSKSKFDAFRDSISPLLSKLGADPAAISGVRLTRLPGVLREGTVDKDGRYQRYTEPRLQRLLFLNPEPEVLALINLPRVRTIDIEQ